MPKTSVQKRRSFASYTYGQIVANQQPSNILEDLEDLKPHFNLKQLLKSADQTFKLFSSFYEATTLSDDPSVVAITREIKAEFGSYCRAIDESITTAQDGFTYTADGVHLCDFLEQERPLSEVISFVKEMLDLAGKAHAKAESTSINFRSIRTKLAKIAESLPRQISIHSGSVDADFIIQDLPMTKHKSRDQLSVFEVLVKLSRDISNLEEYISEFADWWIVTETKLASILTRAEQLVPGHVHNLRLRTIRRGWEDVRDRYLGYKVNIARLRDTAQAYGSHDTGVSPRLPRNIPAPVPMHIPRDFPSSTLRPPEHLPDPQTSDSEWETRKSSSSSSRSKTRRFKKLRCTIQ